jgi:hypothetical protein
VDRIDRLATLAIHDPKTGCTCIAVDLESELRNIMFYVSRLSGNGGGVGAATPSASLEEQERHELECLRARVQQLEYPCSPHCDGYLREMTARNNAERAAKAETGWLIEFSQRVSARPCWYGKTDDGLGQATDPNKALRFARKEDAEMVIEDFGWTEARATEHMWCDPLLQAERSEGGSPTPIDDGAVEMPSMIKCHVCLKTHEEGLRHDRNGNLEPRAALQASQTKT